MPFEAQSVEAKGVAILALSGQLDSRAAPEFEKSLLKLLTAGEREILLDLKRLEYVASAGLRVFVMIGKRLEADGGRLALCALNPSVLKVLEVSGFVPLFPIRPDRQDAIAWLTSNAHAARISNLAGDLLRKDAGPTQGRPAGVADQQKSSYAAEILGERESKRKKT